MKTPKARKLFSVIDDTTGGVVFTGYWEQCREYLSKGVRYETHSIITYKQFLRSLFK